VPTPTAAEGAKRGQKGFDNLHVFLLITLLVNGFKKDLCDIIPDYADN